MRLPQCQLHCSQYRPILRELAVSGQTHGHIAYPKSWDSSSNRAGRRRQPAIRRATPERYKEPTGNNSQCIDQDGGDGRGGEHLVKTDFGDDDAGVPVSHYGLLGIAFSLVSSGLLTAIYWIWELNSQRPPFSLARCMHAGML